MHTLRTLTLSSLRLKSCILLMLHSTGSQWSSITLWVQIGGNPPFWAAKIHLQNNYQRSLLLVTLIISNLTRRSRWRLTQGTRISEPLGINNDVIINTIKMTSSIMCPDWWGVLREELYPRQLWNHYITVLQEWKKWAWHFRSHTSYCCSIYYGWVVSRALHLAVRGRGGEEKQTRKFTIMEKCALHNGY